MDSPNTMGNDTFADRQARGATNPSTPKASNSEDETNNLAISTTRQQQCVQCHQIAMHVHVVTMGSITRLYYLTFDL